MSIKKTIVVSLQVEWLHKWEWCHIKEVSFLKNSHRHIFWIKAYKEVCHNDRDVEIIMFKRKIIQFLNSKYYKKANTLDFGNMSCEMIAEKLIRMFDLTCCEVLEDNENWALLYNNK